MLASHLINRCWLVSRRLVATVFMATGFMAGGLAAGGLAAGGFVVGAAAADQPLTGKAAYGDWRQDRPGVARRIDPNDLARPYATRSAGNPPSSALPAPDATPKVPAGFSVSRFATGLDGPRLLRVAPNGDIFVAETAAGTIRVLRAADGAPTAGKAEVFAHDLDAPFGIAFYPPGPNPTWIYIAETNAILRFPYRSGDLTASGKPQTIVAKLVATMGGHSTRDIRFSLDGTQMFVSVGSGSNVAESMPEWPIARTSSWEADHSLGATWGEEADRADVLVFDPDGSNRRIYASGIRNCVGLAIQPADGQLWCSTNERDGLGDDLVPDYVTRVRHGAFYGWPWYYVGAHEDPRHRGERPDLAGHVTVPDVLLQPHSASLEMTFYEARPNGVSTFPATYDGDAFAALHGSWNRAKRTGYKVVRIKLNNGVPTGVYEDFMTGFVIDDETVWGRPVGVAEAHDGALLVTQDDNGILWRIAYAGSRAGQ